MPRTINTFILIGAVILLALGMWRCSPANRDELCTKLETLQAIKSGKIEDALKDLASTAENYRGDQAASVRTEAGKLRDVKGWFIQSSSLDNATVAIRNVCGASSFGKSGH